MHFAVGMGCAGAVTTIGCFIFRRGWRWIPAAMTAGGVWAVVPDMPRIFREDFPSLPFAASLGAKDFERSLHRWGDLFFFHKQMDIQPNEYALLGLTLILIFYNLSIALLMWMEHRQRNSVIHRAYRAHGDLLPILTPQDIEFELKPPPDDDPPEPPVRRPTDSDGPVIARIGGDRQTGS